MPLPFLACIPEPTHFDLFELLIRNLSGHHIMVLTFTLSEEGVAVLHDALACMFKFSDDVCLEAKKDKVWMQRLHRRPMNAHSAYTRSPT